MSIEVFFTIFRFKITLKKCVVFPFGFQAISDISISECFSITIVLCLLFYLSTTVFLLRLLKNYNISSLCGKVIVIYYLKRLLFKVYVQCLKILLKYTFVRILYYKMNVSHVSQPSNNLCLFVFYSHAVFRCVSSTPSAFVLISPSLFSNTVS